MWPGVKPSHATCITNSLRQDTQEHWERCSHQPYWATLLSRPHRQADASVAKPYQENQVQIEGWEGGEQFGLNAI